MAVGVRLLGPVEALVDGGVVDLGGPRQRRLIGVLALTPNALVDTTSVIDAVWADGDYPADPRETLRSYVSRLRSTLGGSATVSGRGGGYRLVVHPDDVDATRFVSLSSTADVESLHAALRLWRGAVALAGFEHEEWARPSSVRLQELRARAADELGARLIEVGRFADAVVELETAAARAPLRERTHQLLMVGLHHCGRQAESLRVYQSFRHRLATDLGLEPSSDLRTLEAKIATDALDRADHDGPAPHPPLRGYAVVGRIGEGASAVVYRGLQPSVRREVAIKQIHAELADDPSFIRRFEAEARLVARLEHPNIVPLFDYWREPGSAYLVMRWLRGGSLAQAIASEPWSLDRAISMVRHVGAALAFAHHAGVVHRDVKPANILLDEEGNAYLSDFGVAVEVNKPRQAWLSRGSPVYAPPEQLSGAPVRPTVDIYGLAVVLFQTLTGLLPATGDRRGDERMPRRSRSDRLRDHRPDLPAELDEVLSVALSPSPEERFATVEAFVAAVMGAAGTTSDAAAGGAIDDLVDGRPGIETATLRNPYKGLLSFDEADADDFHGRDRLVEELLHRLAGDGVGARFLAVIGPSGSGKSSVVRAGLLPGLRAGRVAGSADWFVTTMVPGPKPFEELERALLRVAGGHERGATGQPRVSGEVLDRVRGVLGADHAQLLLVIDQFEELFTLVDDADERTRFLDGLAHAVGEPDSSLRIVITLRADFYDRPLRHAAFARLLGECTVTVKPLAPDEIERAITAPALGVGVAFEPGLVAALVGDAATQPGALPLLQFALTELFDRRDGTTLTLAAYRDLGGLTGALTARAEQIFSDAGVQDRAAIRRLLVRLVTFGEGAEDTRRRVLRAELLDDVPTANAIESYGSARLLSFDHDPATREPTVEIAHEALIRRWPRLRDWLEVNRAGMRIHRHLTTASQAWANGGRDRGELYRGARLQAADEWHAGRAGELNALEQEFLDASLTARHQEQETERRRLADEIRQNRRLRRLLVSVACIATLAVVAGGLALQQQARARRAADTASTAAADAETRRLVSDAVQLVATNRRVALLLAVEAYRRDPSVASLGALQRVLIGMDDVLAYVGGGARYEAVAWIGTEQVVAARQEAIDLFDQAGHLERSFPIRTARLLAVSPDHRTLAIGFDGGVSLLDLGDETPEAHALDFDGLVQALAFSPDGRRLAVGRRDGQVLVVDTGARAIVGSWPAHPEHSAAELGLADAYSEVVPHVPASSIRGVAALAYSPDGTVLFSAGWGSARSWLAESGRARTSTPLARVSGDITTVSVGTAVGFADIDGQARVLAVDRDAIHVIDPETGDELAVHQLADRTSTATIDVIDKPVALRGSTIMTVLRSGQVEVIDPAAPGSTTFDTQFAEITDLAVSDDGRRAAAAGPDGVVLIARNGDRLLARAVAAASAGELTVTDDGEYVLRGAARPLDWNLYRVGASGADVISITAAAEYLSQAFSDRYELAITRPRQVEVFDIRAGRMVTTVPWEHDGGVPAAWLSADESRLLMASLDGFIDVFSWPEPTLLLRFDRPDLVSRSDVVLSGSLSPDGTTFIGVGSNGSAVEWDLDANTVRVLSKPGGSMRQAAYSHDGTKLATIGNDGSIVLRDARSLQPVSASFIGETSSTATNLGPWFSGDDRYLITTGDGAARLWDIESGRQIGGVFPSDPAWNSSASTNGRWIIGGLNGRILRWEVDPSRWPELACRAAGRNLSADEWRQFGPAGAAQRATCPQYETG